MPRKVNVGSFNRGAGGRYTTNKSFRAAAGRIRATIRASGQAAGRGLRAIGEVIMTDVKASRPGAGVPRDTGALAGTGRVTGPRKVPTGVAVELSFGGAAAPYALKQHEILTYRHKVGEARYLVRGLERWKAAGNAALNALRANYQAALRAVGRGGKR